MYFSYGKQLMAHGIFSDGAKSFYCMVNRKFSTSIAHGPFFQRALKLIKRKPPHKLTQAWGTSTFRPVARNFSKKSHFDKFFEILPSWRPCPPGLPPRCGPDIELFSLLHGRNRLGWRWLPFTNFGGGKSIFPLLHEWTKLFLQPSYASLRHEIKFFRASGANFIKTIKITTKSREKIRYLWKYIKDLT